MKAAEMLTLVQNKADVCGKAVLAKAGNKNPDYYKTQKEFRMWKIIQSLLEDIGEGEVHITEEVQNYFSLLTMDGPNKIVIEVHEGDNALELLDKYKDVKDIWNKLKKACDNAGLKIVGSSVVKA